MARRKRTKRSNPFGFGNLGIEPFTMAIGAATAAASLLPTVAKLFGVGTAAPAAPAEPAQNYQRDLQTQIALKTQAAVAAQQKQAAQAQLEAAKAQSGAAVAVEQIKAESYGRLLLYGAGVVAVGLGIYIVVRSLQRKGKAS